jgi:hypothetical protein
MLIATMATLFICVINLLKGSNAEQAVQDAARTMYLADDEAHHRQDLRQDSFDVRLNAQTEDATERKRKWAAHVAFDRNLLDAVFGKSNPPDRKMLEDALNRMEKAGP